MSNIQIDTTTEKDAVRLTFSAPIESEVLTDALHTVLHLLRANCKMGNICTSQFNALVQTACDLEDRINKKLAATAAEVKVAAGVPTPTAATSATTQSADAQSFRDSITEISRQIVMPFVLMIDKHEGMQYEVEKAKTFIFQMEDDIKQIPSTDVYVSDSVYARSIAMGALWLLLQRHHAADPIRNIPAFSMAIMNCIVNLLVKKNHDYGNSFGDQLAEDGPIVFKIRMKDKISRLRTLLTTEAQVKDESIEDTLRDIIGYCILFIHHYQD